MDETDQVEKDRVQELIDQVAGSSDDWTFTEWLTIMRTLQEVAYGAHYEDFEPDVRAESIRMNFMAAVKELSEMTDEMGWKPWASPQGWVHNAEAVMEGVDTMHFLANLLSHTRVSGRELTTVYKRKVLKNLQRQLDGYDAVTDKCAQCKRDLTELEPTAIYESTFNGVLKKFCNRDHFRKYCSANREEILSDNRD